MAVGLEFQTEAYLEMWAFRRSYFRQLQGFELVGVRPFAESVDYWNASSQRKRADLAARPLCSID